MNNIVAIHLIDENRLDQRHYFKSLTEYAYFCGILTQNNIARLQSELLSLLAEQTERLTNGKSSSIPKEKAQELLSSAIFTIGLFLKSCDSADKAAEALRTASVRYMFDEGLEIVRNKMVISHRIQKKIAANLLKTPNVYYRSTIIDGINGFFKLYTPQFSAHEIHITADYSTLAARPELDGIEFIEKYLRYIEAENFFCKIFDENDIDRLMRKVSPDYENCPINIFESVLLCSLGLIISGKYPKFLDLSEADIKKLSSVFNKKRRNDISETLKNAVNLLLKSEKVPQKCVGYIMQCIPKLTQTVCNAANINALDKVFITTDKQNNL